jgi:hypothetical protein
VKQNTATAKATSNSDNMFGKIFGKQGSEYGIKFILKRFQADKKKKKKRN